MNQGTKMSMPWCIGTVNKPKLFLIGLFHIAAKGWIKQYAISRQEN